MITPEKKTKEKKRFVIYTRCSTDDQAQGDFTTLDAQAHHCKNMLDAFGYELAELGNKGIINDDGYSGKDLNRPGIQMILNSIQKQKKFDGIIFFRLDRITRNPRDLYALIDLFRANEIDFISVRENLDSSTAIGRVVIGILGLLSAFERELTGERVKASAIARVRQGKWVGGFLPYGYKLVKNGDPLPNGRQPHKVVVNEDVAPKLKLIWEMASENKSLWRIAQELDRMGLKSPQGMEWRKQSIGAIIKNPFYKGYLNYADEIHKGNHDAIVDPKLWEKANRILTAKLPGHGFRRVPKEYYYLLSGLLRCGKCGSHLISISSKGQNGKRFFYYICGRSKQGIGCDQKASSATMFDSALIDFFRKASRDQDIIVKAIGNAIIDSQTKLDKIESIIADVDTKLETVRAEAKKLLALAIAGTVSQSTTYKTKMAELDEEIFKLEDKLAKLQAQKNVTQMSAQSGRFLHQNLRFAMHYLDQAPLEAQRSLLQSLIKEIIVFEDRIELRMYLGEPDETMPGDITPEYKKSPAETGEALKDQRLVSSGRKKWLPVCNPLHNRSPLGCQSECAYHSTSYQRACRSRRPEAASSYTSSVI